MKNLQICLYTCLVVLTWGISAVATQTNEFDSPISFLDPNQILKTWEYNYAHFESMKVSYKERVLEATPPEDNPNRYDNLVRLMHVERIEQGQRFWIRYSTAKEGFKKPDSIIGGSFDGKVTREYIASENSGMIIAGMIGRNTETMNKLKNYMLLSRPLLLRKNLSGPFEIYWIEDPNAKPELSRILSRAIATTSVKVLPKLEPVAGEMCHVLELSYKGNLGQKIWLAHEKGMLPLKYQRYVNDNPLSDITVEQIGSVKTEGEIIWYPNKATRTSNRQRRGKIKYELTTHEFVPDVEADDNTFRFVFPPGTEIYDRIRGMSYVAEDTSDSKEPASLMGKPLPELKEIGIALSLADVNDRMMLVCFFDMQQRSSRNCLQQLSKRAYELTAKDVVVVAIHASKVDEKTLNEWMKKNSIPFPVGMIQGDEEKTRFNWGVQSLPWLILTDAKHVVTAEGFTINELEEKIER